MRLNPSKYIATGASSLLLVGLLIRLTIKDQLYGPSALYYALPWIVLAGLALVAAAAWFQLQNRRWIALGFTLLAIPLALTHWQQQQVHNPSKTPSCETITVLYWNLNRPDASIIPAEVDAIQQLDPDLIVLGETNELSDMPEDFFRRQFSAYQVDEVALPGMVLMAKGDILQQSGNLFYPRQRMIQATVKIKGQTLAVYGVDLDASAFANKRKIMSVLMRTVAKQKENVPSIIAGDFNLPLDSTHFETTRITHRHALETGYTGSIATWPVPTPVLAIDHIWASKDLRILEANKYPTGQSDHTIITCTLQLPAKSNKPPRRILL